MLTQSMPLKGTRLAQKEIVLAEDLVVAPIISTS